MKKASILLTFFVSVILFGCKEIGPPIDFGHGAQHIDTTYVGSVESPQPRNVMIEEFTGVYCPNCPAGHAILESIQHTDTGRVVIAGLYIIGPPQTDPVPSLTSIPGISDSSFQTVVATTIGNSIYGGIGSLPSAGIDRVNYSSLGMLLDRSVWGSTVDTRLTVPTIVNLYLTSTYDTGSKAASVIFKAAFTQAISGKVQINIGIIENNIINAQEDQTQVDTFYVQNHVLRDMITTPATGTPILNSVSSIEAGRVFQSQFTYKITNPTWVPSNCKVFAFMTDSTQQVMQAVETSLTGF
ncbi:MAG TPA: Omp28-related outer membrane protein [Flavipsychrobacter sp.]|nr:Omp28-related outer membrane protein [Flavipsychrobacter sp.]